ncbi:MAG: META domain-containing protein [Thermomicrobiales bacterium]|nr:META domain-containing protein [Thermomicrobiales bacterium]
MRSLLQAAALAIVLALGVAPGVISQAQAQTVSTPVPGPETAIPPIVWSMTEFPAVGPITEPGRYTVQFLEDGQISAKADCNWVAGVWTAADGVLDVTITRTTLAACPPDSLEQPFVQALHDATSYAIDGFALTISGPTGDMRFMPNVATPA